MEGWLFCLELVVFFRVDLLIFFLWYFFFFYNLLGFSGPESLLEELHSIANLKTFRHMSVALLTYLRSIFVYDSFLFLVFLFKFLHSRRSPNFINLLHFPQGPYYCCSYRSKETLECLAILHLLSWSFAILCYCSLSNCGLDLHLQREEGWFLFDWKVGLNEEHFHWVIFFQGRYFSPLVQRYHKLLYSSQVIDSNIWQFHWLILLFSCIVWFRGSFLTFIQ